jgi:hypothetical protein
MIQERTTGDDAARVAGEKRPCFGPILAILPN